MLYKGVNVNNIASNAIVFNVEHIIILENHALVKVCSMGRRLSVLMASIIAENFLT